MKVIKLHQDGKAFLVNLDNVSEVYPVEDNKSLIYFNFTTTGGQVRRDADESIDEILELIKQASE